MLISNNLYEVAKSKIPLSVKEYLKGTYFKFKILNKKRIFCISFQKTGTTSVGNFFEHFGYPTGRWQHALKNQWEISWYDGDFESIFSSNDFKSRQVFEDSPWWYPEFYKVLYHRFPGSKFILFYRDEDDWFRSMVAHGKGKSTNRITKMHAKVYRREDEFYERVDKDPEFNTFKVDPERMMMINGMENHYKSIYVRRNREVIEFFERHDRNALFACDLYDIKKWQKLGDFIGIDVPEDFDMHANQTREPGKFKNS